MLMSSVLPSPGGQCSCRDSEVPGYSLERNTTRRRTSPSESRIVENPVFTSSAATVVSERAIARRFSMVGLGAGVAAGEPGDPHLPPS